MESYGSDTFIDRLRTEFGILVASQDPDMLEDCIRASLDPYAFGLSSGIWR